MSRLNTKAESVSRQATNKLLEMIEQGLLDKDQVIMACIKYMSEDDVADMCHVNEFLPEPEEETFPINDEDELRDLFWQTFPDLDQEKIKDYSGNGLMYKTDTRVCWVNWIDSMQKDGQISEELASEATLD